MTTTHACSGWDKNLWCPCQVNFTIVMIKKLINLHVYVHCIYGMAKFGAKLKLKAITLWTPNKR